MFRGLWRKWFILNPRTMIFYLAWKFSSSIMLLLKKYCTKQSNLLFFRLMAPVYFLTTLRTYSNQLRILSSIFPNIMISSMIIFEANSIIIGFYLCVYLPCSACHIFIFTIYNVDKLSAPLGILVKWKFSLGV